MAPSRAVLPLLILLAPVACAIARGPSPDAAARKAAMTADREAVALGTRSMDELRYAARESQRSLGAVQAAANLTGPAREASLRRARDHSSIARFHVLRSDRLAAIATARGSVHEALARLLEEQIRYRDAHGQWAPTIEDLDVRSEAGESRILSSDPDGFLAWSASADVACLLAVEGGEAPRARYTCGA